jgi:UDP-N-acetylmuramoyl-L-alanyl-D-glutamate--2,6-diaminopimelate ligase
MKLSNLIAPWISSVEDCDVTGIENDSRRLVQGQVFLAYPGAQTDGRKYIHAVIEQGAAAVLYDPQGMEHIVSSRPGVPVIPFEHLYQRMGELAARFYDYPSKKMTIIGITGTNGKTTIAYQLAQAYALLGHRAAYIGTLGWGEPFHLQPLPNTTPDGLCLQNIFHQCLNQGIEYVCMEVSSHALAEDRVRGVQFKQAIFTNLTRDHLDFHHTMAAYCAAKARLFAHEGLEVAILNVDDQASEDMRSATPASVRIIDYGLAPGMQVVRADDVKMTRTGTSFSLKTPEGEGPCFFASLGEFNLSNALAMVSSMMAEGFTFHDMVTVLPKLKPAPGRMELVLTEPVVLVDFAHTPDALENVLKSLRRLGSGKIILVFGCGGDRDAGKRPLMGKIAGEFADVLILTNDNPRTEDPEVILQAIRAGVSQEKEVYTIPDRRAAIIKALQMASVEDVVLVAGKGHEMVQQIGQTKFHFSDQEEIKKAVLYEPLDRSLKT